MQRSAIVKRIFRSHRTGGWGPGMMVAANNANAVGGADFTEANKENEGGRLMSPQIFVAFVAFCKVLPSGGRELAAASTSA